MKIFLTEQEYTGIARIMESIEAGSVNTMTEDISVNPLMSVSHHQDYGICEVIVDSEYMADYLNVIAESTTIIVPIIKSIVGLGKAMLQKLDDVVVYYTKKRQNADKRAMSMQAVESAPHVEDILDDVLKNSSAENFEQLDDSLQRMLLLTYGNSVKEAVNKLLKKK